MLNGTTQHVFVLCCVSASGNSIPPMMVFSKGFPVGRSFKIGQKKLFFANKDTKTNFDAWTRLYLNKLEGIMRALSDALPTGHRAMANPTLQLHFGSGRATPPVSHSHNWPSRRMQHFLHKIGPKSYLLPIKTQKLILTLEWYYTSLHCRPKAMIFKKNGQFEGDIICHLNWRFVLF